MTKQIRALARGLTVVNAINAAPGPVSLGDLHKATGIDRATLLRILATLDQEGWIFRGMGDRLYRLAYKLHELGEQVHIHDAIAQIAAPVLEQLQQELHWPCDISVFDGEGMAIIETSRSRSPFVLNREVIGYRPSMLKSAIGRAYLAYCDPRRRESILRRARSQDNEEGRLAADSAYIERTLQDVRNRGFGMRDSSLMSLPADTLEEFSAMALPIIVQDDIQACLSFVWMKSAYTSPGIEDAFYQQLKPRADTLAELFEENGLY
uniref:IclR family transcriptional regulator domain-containing protein n=1 Tax=Marinobacterium profundum TaxID=1714300 RepID=UPI0008377AB3|nr:helix-turn-helix domain-containing protein [Marinobacterium profundum]